MAEIDVMDARRIRDKYKGNNLYLILSWDEEGVLYDLQPSLSSEVVNHDQHTLSNLDAMAMLTALCCREYEPNYIAARLLQVARGPHTLPSILANAILEHGVQNG